VDKHVYGDIQSVIYFTVKNSVSTKVNIYTYVHIKQREGQCSGNVARQK
jgi:hypothetical protein